MASSCHSHENAQGRSAISQRDFPMVQIQTTVKACAKRQYYPKPSSLTILAFNNPASTSSGGKYDVLLYGVLQSVFKMGRPLGRNSVSLHKPREKGSQSPSIPSFIIAMSPALSQLCKPGSTPYLQDSCRPAILRHLSFPDGVSEFLPNLAAACIHRLCLSVLGSLRMEPLVSISTTSMFPLREPHCAGDHTYIASTGN